MNYTEEQINEVFYEYISKNFLEEKVFVEDVDIEDVVLPDNIEQQEKEETLYNTQKEIDISQYEIIVKIQRTALIIAMIFWGVTLILLAKK
jgi:hypothetical protein